jgi:hypothetical protein
MQLQETNKRLTESLNTIIQMQKDLTELVMPENMSLLDIHLNPQLMDMLNSGNWEFTTLHDLVSSQGLLN